MDQNYRNIHYFALSIYYLVTCSLDKKNNPETTKFSWLGVFYVISTLGAFLYIDFNQIKKTSKFREMNSGFVDSGLAVRSDEQVIL